MKRLLLPGENTDQCVLIDRKTGERHKVSKKDWRALMRKYKPQVTDAEFELLWERLHGVCNGDHIH